MNKIVLANESETKKLGADFATRLKPGDVVFLHGVLGAGKTTLVRGLLEKLGFDGPVRSPTFNIVQEFPTDPPLLHVDLFRVRTHHGLGLEDYLSTHVVLIEWPERASGLIDDDKAWHLTIEIDGDARSASVTPPKN